MNEKDDKREKLRDVYPKPGRFGDFEIIVLESMGDLSAVYRARRSDKDRALKVPRPDKLGDPAALDRFCREMDILHGLRSSNRNRDNIVNIISSGSYRGIPFMELEYLRGTSLSEVIAHTTRGGRWSVRVLLEHMRSIALALQAVHALGIVHRDVKPSNIFVVGWTRERPHVERVVLLDFGDAWAPKNVTYLQTYGATVTGIAHYAAPEHVRGESITPASDIFSLTAVLYRFVYGHSPYHTSVNDESGEAEVLERAKRGEVYAPMNLQPKTGLVVPEAFTRFLRKGLSPDPAARHQNMGEFLAEFDQVIKQCPQEERVSKMQIIIAVTMMMVILTILLLGDSLPRLVR